MHSNLTWELDYFSLHVKNLFKCDPLVKMNMAKFQIIFSLLSANSKHAGNRLTHFKNALSFQIIINYGKVFLMEKRYILALKSPVRDNGLSYFRVPFNNELINAEDKRLDHAPDCAGIAEIRFF